MNQNDDNDKNDDKKASSEDSLLGGFFMDLVEDERSKSQSDVEKSADDVTVDAADPVVPVSGAVDNADAIGGDENFSQSDPAAVFPSPVDHVADVSEPDAHDAIVESEDFVETKLDTETEAAAVVAIETKVEDDVEGSAVAADVPASTPLSVSDDSDEGDDDIAFNVEKVESLDKETFSEVYVPSAQGDVGGDIELSVTNDDPVDAVMPAVSGVARSDDGVPSADVSDIAIDLNPVPVEAPPEPLQKDSVLDDMTPIPQPDVPSSSIGGELPSDGIEAKSLVYKMMEGEGAEGEDRRRRIGDELVEREVITKDQLNVALQEKKITGKMLGAILVELGFIDQSVLLEFLADEAGFGVFDPKTIAPDPDAIALYEKKIARQYSALPVSIEGDNYYFAMSDPQDVVAMDSIRRFLPRGARVCPLFASPEALEQGIDAAYGYASLIKDILKELEEGEAPEDVSELDEETAFSHPIVRLVNALVFEAVKMGVSDLHFEPEENFVRLRYRLDGVLFTAQTLHKQHWSGIAQRLKIMSQMDIADKISPQDGRFNMEVAGREADFRVSSLPTVHGENIVLRVLDKSASIMPMEALGFSAENREKINRIQAKPEGIVIVTGPTGSGKTTSLYSMLNEINDVDVNIQTLEDPVEYSLPMIRQTHVREGVLDFADGIKALLRQDPDIIFIGEIRDQTTAEMALKAAMTGHQVYTTLHTNDSLGAVPRLIDLGMKPSMLSGAIVAVFAQRLARRLCPKCKQPHSLTPHEKRLLELQDGAAAPQIFRANPEGCPHCLHGYKGRVALVEILLFNNAMNDLLAQNAPISDIRNAAIESGFKAMADDAILKIKDGITDFDAVSKVVDLLNK